MILAFLQFLLPANISAGEKIRFTEPDRPTDIPDQTIQNILSDPLGFGPKKSDGGSLAPILAPPYPIMNGADEKPEDKKWMFDAHGKLDYDAALKQIFKIREYEIDRWSTNPNSKFNTLLGPNDPSGLETNNISGFDRDAGLDSDRNSLTNGQLSGYQRGANDEAFGTPEHPNPEYDFYRLLHPTPSLDPLSRGSDEFTSNPFAPGNATAGLNQPIATLSDRESRERDERSTEFQKLIGANRLLMSPLTELLQNKPGTTRQEINPVLSQRGGEQPLSTQSKTPDPFMGPNAAPRAAFSSALESFNARANPSSLAPSFVAPPDRGIAGPRAPAFEIPRRKF